jgi:hypothetical protein
MTIMRVALVGTQLEAAQKADLSRRLIGALLRDRGRA